MAVLVVVCAAVDAAVTWDKGGDFVAVPRLSARVTDLTGTLNPQQVSALEQRLAASEAKTGNQLALLLVPTTQPEAIEEYSIRVVEQWKLGQKGVDNGVLFLVAKNDRRMRIEVGHGIEGSLPDVVARRILDETVAPRFRAGDYFGGLDAGLARIEQVLTGADPVTAPGAKAGPRPAGPVSEGIRDNLFNFGLLAIFLLPVLGAVLRSMFGRFFGSLVGGTGVGAVAWLITGSLILGVVGALIALVIIAASGFGGLGGMSHRRGGWTSGGFGGGGWGGGSSGGWSGGGGTFGGGGASGNW